MQGGKGVGRLLMRPALFLCLLAALVLGTPGAPLAEEEPEGVLPSCGIRYPSGYDPNTVGIVEGRVGAITRPEWGPVSFRLEAEGERYTVLAAPAWFWEERRIPVREGDLVRVKGSKTMGADGNLYLVAREFLASERRAAVVLRDPGGKPVWSGCGPGGCGRGRGGRRGR